MRFTFSRHSLDYVLVAALALTAYMPGFWWGSPHATAPERIKSWGVDDETPLGPLAEMHNILEPKPDRNLGYPLMYSFVVAGAYAPYLGYLKLSGAWDRPQAEYPFGLADPVGSLKTLSHIAHIVTVLMGVGVVLAAFETARVLRNRYAGFWAALLALSAYPMFYYARNGNVDVPMLFFGATTIMMFARCLVHGFTTRRVIWTSILAGFALGTKEQALGMFLALPLALFISCWRDHNGKWKTWGFWRTPVAGVVAAILSFGIGSGLFVEPSRYIAHVAWMWSRIGQIGQGEIYIPYVFPHGWEGNVGYVARVYEVSTHILSMPAVILGVGGFLMLLWSRSRGTWIAVTIVGYMVFIFISLRSPQMRYIMPGTFLLALPIAFVAAAAWEQKSQIVRWGVTGLVAGVVLCNVVRGVGLTYEMLCDSRYSAAEWLEQRTKPGDTIEFFGPSLKLPPLKAGVTTQAALPWRGISRPPQKDETTAGEVLKAWAEREPRFIIIMPDVSSFPGVPHSNACPPKVYEALRGGTYVYTLAAEFGTAPLFSWPVLPALDYPSVNPRIQVYSKR
jgi:hypothetical protein